MAKRRIPNWDDYNDDLAIYARQYQTEASCDQEIQVLGDALCRIGPKTPPRDRAEWDALLKREALVRQRYILKLERQQREREARNKKAEAGIEQDPFSRPSTTTATCKASGTEFSITVYGLSDRSVRAALAKLTEECDCESGWHEQAS